MFHVVTAPEGWQAFDKDTVVFLAGGITKCPKWQSQMVAMLSDTDLVLLNPRREDFPMGDPNAADAQIRWEHAALRRANAILFWFPYESLCPIVLYELGAWSMTNKPIFVGMDARYERSQDVIIQTGLARPEVKFTFSLDSLADQVKRWRTTEKVYQLPLPLS